jgi:hypothetical protein
MDLVCGRSYRCLLGLEHVLRSAFLERAGAPGHRRFRAVSDCAVQCKLLGPYSFACSLDHCSLVFRNIFPATDWEVCGYAAGVGVDEQLRAGFCARKPVVGESAQKRGRRDPAQPGERAY